MTTQVRTSVPTARRKPEASAAGPSGRRRTPWGFIGPALLPLIVVTVGPLIFLYYISLTNYDLGTALSDARFVGLQNYIRLFSGKDPEFYAAIRNTLTLGICATAVELALGMGVAVLVDSLRDRWRGTLASLLMLPMVVTPVIVGLVWKLMLNSEQGVINWLLIHLGLSPVVWLGAQFSLLSVLIVDVWQWTPFVSLILLAGLASLPSEPHEAAAIDGASAWQSFMYVTVPLLRPIIMLAALLRLVDVLKMFDIIFIMTGGGPGTSTETLAIHVYRLGFYFSGYIGRASATAIVLAVLTMVVSGFMISRLQRASQEA